MSSTEHHSDSSEYTANLISFKSHLEDHLSLSYFPCQNLSEVLIAHVRDLAVPMHRPVICGINCIWYCVPTSYIQYR
jgi:hypothetical protein